MKSRDELTVARVHAAVLLVLGFTVKKTLGMKRRFRQRPSVMR